MGCARVRLIRLARGAPRVRAGYPFDKYFSLSLGRRGFGEALPSHEVGSQRLLDSKGQAEAKTHPNSAPLSRPKLDHSIREGAERLLPT